MSFSIIAAIGKNRELGKNNQLIWHLPGDRKHYVVSKKEGISPSGERIIHVSDLKQFINRHNASPEEIFVIGGAKIYEQLLLYADKLYLTEIEANDTEADAYFPDFDKEKYDKEILAQGEENGLKYTIVCYKLKK